ncbi:MAG: restriction endonuclease subunit S, partial [Humibacter sp.]
ILTSEAPAGRVARLINDDPLVLGQRLFCLRGKAGVLDSGFLYYALQSHPVQSSILGHSTGTTVVGIRQSALRMVRIPAPSFPEQQAIAEVLGALDNKIAANTALADAAERLAVAEMSTMSRSTPLSELVELGRDQSSVHSFRDDLLDHYSLPAFDAEKLPAVQAGSDIKSSKFSLTAPVVLLSKLNPRFPRIWRANPRAGVTSVASTEFLVLNPRETSTAMLWSVLAQPSFSVELDTRAAGTSGSHQRVRPADVLTVPVLDPRGAPPRLRAATDAALAAADLHRAENRTLGATRDTLLPQLMSGKLRVRDAEDAASRAGA